MVPKRSFHVDLAGIDGEVDEGAFLEGEHLLARVAIGAVLMFGVFDGLRSELILELGGRDRKPLTLRTRSSDLLCSAL